MSPRRQWPLIGAKRLPPGIGISNFKPAGITPAFLRFSRSCLFPTRRPQNENISSSITRHQSFSKWHGRNRRPRLFGHHPHLPCHQRKYPSFGCTGFKVNRAKASSTPGRNEYQNQLHRSFPKSGRTNQHFQASVIGTPAIGLQ